MKREFDIVIVGAGMVGLALANLFSNIEQLRITVIDAGEQPTFDPLDDVSLRVSAVAPGSVEILTRIGAWSEISSQRLSRYADMKVWDAAGNVEGPETLSFSAAEFGLQQLGFIVENELIRHALLLALSQTDTEVSFASPVRTISATGERYEVELETGDKLTPDLLIGADGARSFVRTSAGIDIESWQHEQKAFVTHLSPERSHQDTAWQRFLPEGPIGMLPLSDGRISIVWSTTAEKAEAALELTDDELSALIADVSDGVLGKLRPSGPRGAFPLTSQHAEKYVLPGIALVGDAAHAVHPLAGQGVNLGFADAETLASVIAGALAADEHPGDLPVLRQYERARKGANKTMLHFMDGLNRLFSNESSTLARLRGAGMYAFNKSGPIRQRVVEVALGIR